MQQIEVRQQLETRRREEKTQSRALAGISEKVNQFEGRKQKLDEEKISLTEKKTEVRSCLPFDLSMGLFIYFARIVGGENGEAARRIEKHQKGFRKCTIRENSSHVCRLSFA